MYLISIDLISKRSKIRFFQTSVFKVLNRLIKELTLFKNGLLFILIPQKCPII